MSDRTCQHVDCAEPATVYVAWTPVTPGLDDMVMPYCEAHAGGILADKACFPGARRVSGL